MLHATASALGHVETDTSPERALLVATTEVLAAIIDGRGVMTRARMLAMARIVSATPGLKKQASAVRKRVLTQALADRMGVDPQNRRVWRAVTTWSAIVAGAYTGRLGMPADYEPRHDHRLRGRMITRLTETFDEVIGPVPSQQN